MVYFYIALFFLLIHLGYWIYFVSGLLFHKEVSDDVDREVSLLVSFKNEADNIPEFLDSIQSQELNEFIAIDDHSEDDTAVLLDGYSQARRISPEVDRPGKKEAIIAGLQQVNAAYVLFTDADCQPSPQWAESMKAYIKDKDILLGYAPLYKAPGMVNRLARYETLHTALLYLAFANRGLPYMGVGRNMLIKTSAARKAIVYLRKSAQASGDDDLMVNALATGENTTITLDPVTYVYSPAKSSWKDFMKQKLRHVSSSVDYKLRDKFLLGLYSASFMIFYSFVFIGLLFAAGAAYQWVGLLLLKWLVQGAILMPLMSRMNEGDLRLSWPLLDIMMYIYLMIISPLMMFHKKEEW